MPDEFAKLRDTVQHMLVVERLKRQPPKKTRSTQFLGAFLQSRMDVMNYTREELAQRLDVKSEVLDFLLQGDIPDWMINDELLGRLGKALDIPTNQLRIIVHRTIKPAVDRV